MSQDLYLDPTTNDIALVGGTTIILCSTEQELIRQRIYINLNTVQQEWFGDNALGIPYFSSVYGKNSQKEVDAIFRRNIQNVEGVISVTKFESSIDNKIREYTLTFSVKTESGNITDIEVTV